MHPEDDPFKMTVRPEFHITDDAAAEWYLRKLANIEAERGRVIRQAEAIVRQLESDATGLRSRYEIELQDYVRQKLTAEGTGVRTSTFCKGPASSSLYPPG
jgi:hypothetical protein